MLIMDPVSDASSAAAQLWLKYRHEDRPDKMPGNERLRANTSGLTESEAISIQAQSSMADIILLFGDQGQKSDSATSMKAFNEELYEALEMQLAHILEIKNEALPAQDTLHSLYTAYELGMMVLKFISYISRTKPNIYNTKEEVNTKNHEIAERIIQVVIEKSTAIKKGLDESGWIDRVLENLIRGEQTSANELNTVADTLTGIIDENFLEEWAGHVLESWRDSVAGFTYFRVPKAAS
jgi:N-terminal acetyltransferase B complex non-catalytic subunit